MKNNGLKHCAGLVTRFTSWDAQSQKNSTEPAEWREMAVCCDPGRVLNFLNLGV